MGFRSNEKLFPPASKIGKWAYVDDDICRQVQRKVPNGCKLAVMCKMGTFTADDFSSAVDSPVDMVRVLFPLMDEDRKSIFSQTKFEECVQTCRDIKAKGYTVSINLACAEGYTLEQYEQICDLLVYSKAKLSADGSILSPGIPCCHFLYLADTYGAVDGKLAARLVKKLRFELMIRQKCVSCEVGFHGHNNLGDGWHKTVNAIHAGAAIVDSCILGLGRGAGNVQSEVLLCNAKKMQDIAGTSNLDIEPLLHFGDQYIQCYAHLPYCSSFTYGQNCLNLMTGFLQIHPDYAQLILNNYRGLSLVRALKILKMIQERCHATQQNSFHVDIFNAALDATKD